MFNSSLADEVIGKIEANPELHRQCFWAQKTDCGTAYCFAGWTCALNGMTEDSIKWDADFNQLGTGFYYGKNNELFDIATEAQILLGLNKAQSNKLFHHKNTLEDLKRIVKEFANAEVQ